MLHVGVALLHLVAVMAVNTPTRSLIPVSGTFEKYDTAEIAPTAYASLLDNGLRVRLGG